MKRGWQHVKKHFRRISFLAAVVVVMAIALGVAAGCSSQKKAAANPPVKEIIARIGRAVDLSRMKEGDGSNLKKLYGIDAAGLEGFALYTAATNIEADEIAVIKAKDPGAADSLKEKIEKRIADRAARFKDYLPQEYYKIEHHVLKTNGSYILFAVAEDPGKIEAAFDESFR